MEKKCGCNRHYMCSECHDEAVKNTMKKLEDMGELERHEARMEDHVEPKDGFLIALWKYIINKWFKEGKIKGRDGLISIVLILILFVTGCESFKPDSFRIGYSPPYYEDTAMWRGIHVGASWNLGDD